MKNIKRPYRWHGRRGFTLVELMIALAMSGIIIAAVYAAFIAQQRSETNQGQVVQMQQNVRAALELMVKEIRMATYDPGDDANAKIVTATRSQLRIQMDLNDDGDFADADEDITYSIDNDADNDGTADGSSDKTSNLLRRNTNVSATDITIAEGLKGIEFFYRPIDNEFVPTNSPSATNLDDIQSVQITLLMQAGQRDDKFFNNKSYNAVGGTVWPAYGDGFRRRLLTYTVSIRNQGL